MSLIKLIDESRHNTVPSDKLKYHRAMIKVEDGKFTLHGALCYTHLLIGEVPPDFERDYVLEINDPFDLRADGYEYVNPKNFYTSTRPITTSYFCSMLGLDYDTFLSYDVYEMRIISPSVMRLHNYNKYDFLECHRVNKTMLKFELPFIFDGGGVVIADSLYFDKIFIILDEE